MTREEAIWSIAKHIDHHHIGECPHHSRLAEALHMAMYALREQPRWIPVTERLPNEKDANPNKSILAIEIREGLAREWIWDSVARYPKSFTHWMPLPEPPEVEV